MKRKIWLVLLSLGLFIAAWIAAGVAKQFADRRALIPFAVLMVASIAIPISLGIDWLRSFEKRRGDRRGFPVIVDSE